MKYRILLSAILILCSICACSKAAAHESVAAVTSTAAGHSVSERDAVSSEPPVKEQSGYVYVPTPVPTAVPVATPIPIVLTGAWVCRCDDEEIRLAFSPDGSCTAFSDGAEAEGKWYESATAAGYTLIFRNHEFDCRPEEDSRLIVSADTVDLTFCREESR